MSKTLECDIKIVNAELFSKCFRAYLECSDEVQAGIRAMSKIAEDPEADSCDRIMAIESIADALFPGSDDSGELGIDVLAADAGAARHKKDGRNALQEIDDEEASFSAKLADELGSRQWTQADLAKKSGVGQSAISMMLNRNCRPQKRTIQKLAKALGISEDELWPQAD